MEKFAIGTPLIHSRSHVKIAANMSQHSTILYNPLGPYFIKLILRKIMVIQNELKGMVSLNKVVTISEMTITIITGNCLL